MPTTVSASPPVAVPRGRSGWPWGYVADSARDLRFDFVRGLCVLGMICNHVAGSSWARIFSLSNGVLITPAEGFVFISGFVFGMVYRARAERDGLGSAVEKGIVRAWTLYRLSVVLTALFGAALILNGAPALVDVSPNLPTFAADVLLLHRTIYLVDVIVMYAFLTAFAPVALWLLARGKTVWLLGGSFALWLAYQVDPGWAIGIPWTVRGNDLFHIAAWQMPFVAALTLGYHRRTFMAWFSSVAWYAFAAAGLVFAVLVYLALVPTPYQAWLESLSQKQAEGPVRILAGLFVFQLGRLLVTCFWRPLRSGLGWLLLPLGQNSLYAFVMHMALIAATWLPLAGVVGSEGWSTVLQLGTVLVVWYLIKRRFLFNIVPR